MPFLSFSQRCRALLFTLTPAGAKFSIQRQHMKQTLLPRAHRSEVLLSSRLHSSRMLAIPTQGSTETCRRCGRHEDRT
ncbi:hypothetical protein O3I_023545 [Nocardia brasiliensis ATCC 700358]|uniref:Uncharacterized protein n=1 Tax=Nocardia brasiliensis (strain ATCC 700358 / HUJEG-1) TaxID=1133849 RepID=K0EZZ5_NOCB7|nr:hypothetical protein O3I_023545 [Nocardia brasiliensis ATCC 700358]